MQVLRRVLPCILLIFAPLAYGEGRSLVETLLQKEYPKFDLINVAKGSFSGSGGDEYLAFYQEPARPGVKKNLLEVWGAVFLVKNGQITKVFNLRDRGLSTLAYLNIKSYSKIVLDSKLHFGRWAGYAYVGDYNDDGLDEILFFEASGAGFFTYIFEFNGKEFATVLQAERDLSGIETVTRDGHKLLRLYGYGSEDKPQVRGSWYLYEWNKDSKDYEVIEEKGG